MTKEKTSLAEGYLIFIRFIIKSRRIIVDYIVPGVLVFVATILSSVFSDVKIFKLKWYIWLAIIAGSALAGYLSGLAKHLESRASEHELDAQYKGTFDNTSKSVFDYYKFSLTAPTSPTAYVEEVLNYINDNVQAILAANAVTDNDLMTTTLLIEIPSVNKKQKTLKLFSFAPTHRLHRITDDISFDDEYKPSKTEIYETGTTLPGAPTAFLAKVMDYIEDINLPKYNNVEYFKNLKFNSFFSIPITENEDGGMKDKVFAVLNVDSPKANHFISYDFIDEKIYPALRPQIALIKLLNKTGKI
ncbi:MAG: hypothetical protein NTZ74_05505 [Chloroflexi bacterium]|nr:hypothetical protein [Chloroflexota bacterium]